MKDEAAPKDDDASPGAAEGNGKSDAGADSPHLQQSEQLQAARHSAPPALVIHEIVREEGEQELRKRPPAVFWSGLAAGMSMGFSFLCMAMLTAHLPRVPQSHLVASFGYTVGFAITILGRQELFTESTLTAVLPLLVHRDLATLTKALRFWAIVLLANLAGTSLFAWMLARGGLFDSVTNDALAQLAGTAYAASFGTTLLKAILSGWLIALMAWMLPSARSARLFVIVLLTYVVALCGLPHVVAGSVEAAYLVFVGSASASAYAQSFLLPALIGNTIGGVALVALLNHAPLAQDLRSGVSKSEDAGGSRRPQAAR
ncbi:MAG TPA: formate/nitrite transporter family protein [Burkholderiaceae bacterium]|jgi:formate/nitrite transporter FocA (FNT family)|nr:formate/nitrite transporter family protein [Burkholderiaceae bacterium]